MLARLHSRRHTVVGGCGRRVTVFVTHIAEFSKATGVSLGEEVDETIYWMESSPGVNAASSMNNLQPARRVILPVDARSSSHRAFNWFLKYGYRKTDYLIFAHVLQPKYAQKEVVIALDNTISIPTPSGSVDGYDASAVVAKYRNLAEQAGVMYKIEVLADSSVAEAILRLTAESGANLIVVGSYGSSAMRRAFLGSVSRYLVTHSSVPVLVVPPEGKN